MQASNVLPMLGPMLRPMLRTSLARMLRPIIITLLISGAPLSAGVAATPVPPTASSTAKPSPATATPNKPMTAQQYIQQQHELRQEVKKMQQQVDQVIAAHQTAITENQALQLANDNLSVQVKVLQSEQSAQMFLYGAATMVIGGLLGLILGSVLGRRQRRW